MRRERFLGWAGCAVLCAAAYGGASWGESKPVPPLMPPAEPAADPAIPDPHIVLPRLPFDGPPSADDAVVQAGCAGCSGGLLGMPPPEPPAEPAAGGGCASCGGCGSGCGVCYAGRTPCDCCCDPNDRFGHFLCGIYQCICCPDPCYDPHWCALADASFFQTGGPRPVTQTRLRYEEGIDMPFPDKSEFFWARADGSGKGPRHTVPAIAAPDDITYRELHLYTETGIGGFSAWVDVPYRNVSAEEYPGAAGFSDLSFGTKSLLLDCELLQFSLEFNTFTPTGNFTKGLGTGHVSLEPGLLAALKLTPATYLQGELAYRFPIGGDPNFEGPVFHYHLSLNHLLCHCGHGVQLIGTAELNGYEFCGGAYTGPGNTSGVPVDLGVSGVGDVLNLGSGVRLVLCDKIDFGVGGFVNATGDDNSIAKDFFQFDFRWRF